MDYFLHSVTRWGLLSHNRTRLDGITSHLVFDNRLPVLFVTRREARAWAKGKFGYIKTRPDLRREPHCLRLPKPVRISIAVEG